MLDLNQRSPTRRTDFCPYCNTVRGNIDMASNLVRTSYVTVPIIASIGTYALSGIDAEGLIRLIIFGLIDVVLPVSYAPLLFVVFSKPAWKAAFAKGRTA